MRDSNAAPQQIVQIARMVMRRTPAANNLMMFFDKEKGEAEMSYLSKVVCLVAILIASAVARPAPAAPVIVNGDFSTPGVPPDPFDGWSTFPLLGDPPADGGGFALFVVTDFGDARQLEQTFTLPAGALTLSFEILLTARLDGVTDPNQPQPLDSIQATLFDLDTNGDPDNPLFPSGDPTLFPAFYSIDSDLLSPQEFYDPAFVSVLTLLNGWRRVTLNLSSLASQDLLLDFTQLGWDDGLRTEVWLDNVVVTLSTQGQVIPEPASWAIWAGMALVGCVRARRRNAWLPGFTIRRNKRTVV